MKNRILIIVVTLLSILIINIVIFDGDLFTTLDATITNSLKSEIHSKFDESKINTYNEKVVFLINDAEYEKLLNLVSSDSGSLNNHEMDKFLGKIINDKGEFKEIVSIVNSNLKKDGKNFVRSKIKLSYQNGYLNFEVIWDEYMEIVGLNLK